MKKWLITSVCVSICALVAMMLASGLATPRVTYNGRSVNEWAFQLYSPGRQRDDAVAALNALGQKAVPDLVRLLAKSELPFRKEVRSAVPSLPAVTRPLVLQVYGTPPASEAKIAAARALAILGPDATSASSALELRMRDKDPAVANEAGIALAQVSPDCVRQFEAALRDKNSNARRAAAYALGGLGTEAGPAVPGLLKALEDPDQFVRESALGSIWRVGATAIPPILEFIVRERGPTREQLANGLERAYLGVPPQFSQFAKLPFDTPELQRDRAETISKLGAGHEDPVVGRVLAAMLNDPSPEVRVAAIETLHNARLPTVIIGLTRRLQDEDASVRAEAARALGTMGMAARPALIRLRGLAADEQEPVRLAAAEALVQIEGK